MDNRDLHGVFEAYQSIHKVEDPEISGFEIWVGSLLEEGCDLSDCTYEELYGQYIEEQPKGDIGYRAGRGIIGALRDLPAGLAGQLQGKDNAALQRQRERGRKFTELLTKGKFSEKPVPKPSNQPYKSPFANRRDQAIAKARQIQGSPVVGSRPSPAARPAAAPAARPSASSAPKPSAAAKPSPSAATPQKSPMERWREANPKLAAAAAERERTRGTSATTNPLMRDMKSRLPAPTSPSPAAVAAISSKPTSTIIPAKPTGAQNMSAAKTSNQTTTAFSSPQLAGQKKTVQTQSFEWGNATTLRDVADAYRSVYEAKKKDQDKDGDNDFADVRIARMIASGVPKEVAIAKVKNKPYNEEVAIDEATLSAKAARAGKDIGAKGKNFAKIAASAAERYGSEESGKRVAGAVLKKMRAKAHEEYEINEATRMRKELGKEGEIATRKELAARSKSYKRSDSVDKTIAAAERGADRPYIKHKRDESDADRKRREEKQSRVLRGLAASRRGSLRDKPRAGMRGYAAKVEGDNKELQTARQKAMSAGTLSNKERKQLGEQYQVYEMVASYLLENNFAESIVDANVIIENMSESWFNQILSEF